MLNYTSGTTGDSKGVKVTHWGILSAATLGAELNGVEPAHMAKGSVRRGECSESGGPL